MLYIFDADGTLRRSTVPDQACPNRPGEWEALPGVRERLARINWGTNDFAVASNQAGVAKGHLGEAMARQMLLDLIRDLGIPGWGYSPKWSVQICPHASPVPWTDPPLCGCRKPAPGMLFAAMAGSVATPEITLFIGDLPTDEEAARNAGCSFAWAWDFFGHTHGAWVAMLEERAGRDRAHREMLAAKGGLSDALRAHGR